MFRKINEVLFRNERMCATRFSTSGVAYLRMTVLVALGHNYRRFNQYFDSLVKLKAFGILLLIPE